MNLLITMLHSRAGLGSRLRFNMKPFFAILAAFVALASGRVCAAAADEEGVALAIIYDTSGSMKEMVRDQTGKPAPKYVIANRALIEIARQIQTFATNTASGSPRKVNAGLFVFSGMGAKEALKFGPFDAAALQEWAK